MCVCGARVWVLDGGGFRSIFSALCIFYSFLIFSSFLSLQLFTFYLFSCLYGMNGTSRETNHIFIFYSQILGSVCVLISAMFFNPTKSCSFLLSTSFIFGVEYLFDLPCG